MHQQRSAFLGAPAAVAIFLPLVAVPPTLESTKKLKRI